MSSVGALSTHDAMIDLLEKELKNTVAHAERLRFRWWAWPLAGVIGFVVLGFGSLALPHAQGEEGDLFVGGMAFLGAFAAMALYGLTIFITRQVIARARRSLEYQVTKARAELLKESIEEDFFTKLVKINFRYIDQYYYQTQQQADKSFQLSSVAASVGFMVVITGIIMMFAGYTQPAYVTAGIGALGEFIAAVFFYLYNRTILKMGEYHEKLVLTQNISVALKIAEGLPAEAKTEAQKGLIDRLTQDVNRYLAEFKEAKA